MMAYEQTSPEYTVAIYTAQQAVAALVEMAKARYGRDVRRVDFGGLMAQDEDYRTPEMIAAAKAIEAAEDALTAARTLIGADT